MIVGIGVDIIEVERMERAVRRARRLLARVFTPAELEYCLRARNPFLRLAVRFAAKEAVMKALGCGWGQVGWREIEVQHDGAGRPQVVLRGRARALAEERRIGRLLLSLAHTEQYAVAQVVAESA